MLYWEIFDSGRKLQFIGIWGYHFNDFVKTNVAVIEFAAWSLCYDILGIKPNLVTFLECRYLLQGNLVTILLGGCVQVVMGLERTAKALWVLSGLLE